MAQFEKYFTLEEANALIPEVRGLLEHLAPLLPDADQAPSTALEALTEREREVLVLMARGRSNTEIAGDLFLSGPTVKTHVTRILAKLQLRDRVHAVVLAYECGLVRPGAG